MKMPTRALTRERYLRNAQHAFSRFGLSTYGESWQANFWKSLTPTFSDCSSSWSQNLSRSYQGNLDE